MRHPVYLYGMKSGEFAPGNYPESDFIERQDDIIFDEYKAILIYARPLKQKEREEYQLDYLGDRVAP